jgi:arylsulfatase A-like enzyme
VPLASYLDYYRPFAIPEAMQGDWSEDDAALPLPLRMNRAYYGGYRGAVLTEVRRAFYALCTHIDHQLRIVIGTLREEGVLDDTIVLIAADHGEMLGDFGLFAKRTYYEGSGCVPMVLMGRAGDQRVGHHRVDDRLVGLQDLMPTLLDLAGLPVPQSCDGLSMVGERRRQTLYGDCLENVSATRMLHDGRHKLIWYPAGNHLQLFDLEDDPGELRNRVADPDYATVRARLIDGLVDQLYGIDVEQGWVKDGKLAGFEAPAYEEHPDRGLNGQRGLHFPQPPQVAQDVMVGFPT